MLVPDFSLTIHYTRIIPACDKQQKVADFINSQLIAMSAPQKWKQKSKGKHDIVFQPPHFHVIGHWRTSKLFKKLTHPTGHIPECNIQQEAANFIDTRLVTLVYISKIEFSSPRTPRTTPRVQPFQLSACLTIWHAHTHKNLKIHTCPTAVTPECDKHRKVATFTTNWLTAISLCISKTEAFGFEIKTQPCNCVFHPTSSCGLKIDTRVVVIIRFIYLLL